jgi:hypothetical protein
MTDQPTTLAPSVYVPQEPSRWDAALQMHVPSVNLRPAMKYGSIKVLMPPNISVMFASPTVQALKEKLAHATADDFLVAVGDPTLIATCAGIMLRRHGRLNLLKWDRRESQYALVEVVL